MNGSETKFTTACTVRLSLGLFLLSEWYTYGHMETVMQNHELNGRIWRARGERKEERLEGGRGGGGVMCVCVCVCVRGREKGGDWGRKAVSLGHGNCHGVKWAWSLPLMLRALKHVRHVLYTAQRCLDNNIKGLGITRITSIHNNHNCVFLVWFFCQDWGFGYSFQMIGINF